MPDHATKEVLPANLQEHRAVKAWRKLQTEWFETDQIEILKLKTKSAVYRLGGVGPDGSAVIAKRCRTATAVVEQAIYDRFLSRLPLPALSCHGLVMEPEGESCWLFVEDAGRDAYSPACEEHRALAGRWLGMVHRVLVDAELQALLPDRGPAHYLKRLHAAREVMVNLVKSPVLTADEVALLRTVIARYGVIEAHWDELEDFFGACPRTLVHGDFVIKNLRYRNGASVPALLVYDWEMAGWGVPATDLAQSLGRCASPDLEAYCSALRQNGSQTEIGEVRRLANYGNLLRLVDKIFWDTVGIGGETRDFLLRPVLALRNYEPQLAAALRLLDWETA
ncbi:MAG TPA: aminoglycoside phosphotransferase family protein [Verrucomicrobiae bacterium]|nr:aminoglycoside phosphotransferase family protein [Verrucomicrobiae bacterium]